MALSFNLIDEPWIPVVPRDGPPRDVGLRDVLLRAHEWVELYDNSPLVTVALHRLLLAILYRALPAQTEEEWHDLWGELWQARQLPPAPIIAYLERWRDRFDLFSETHPFYQTPGLKMAATDTLIRLANEINFAGIFDHTGEDGPVDFSPAQAARLLVGAQAFALGFGKSGRAQIDDVVIEPPYSADAICLRGLTLLFTGASLFETLLLNLVPLDLAPDDLPCWELDAPHMLRDTLVGGKRRTHPARGPVDRYTWQARLIRLLPEETAGGVVVIRTLFFTQGRSEEKDGGNDKIDPMKAYRADEKSGWVPVSLLPQKAAWRDAHSLLALGEQERRPPAAVEHLAERTFEGILPPEARFRLHAIGMATAPNKPGKFLLWRHERMPIAVGLLRDPAVMERLRESLAAAEEMGAELRARVRRVCHLYLDPEAGATGREPAREDVVDRVADALDALSPYWARLEQSFYKLLDDLATDAEGACTHWRQAIAREAESAFARACQDLGLSARALRAVARVYPFFGDREVAIGGET